MVSHIEADTQHCCIHGREFIHTWIHAHFSRQEKKTLLMVSFHSNIFLWMWSFCSSPWMCARARLKHSSFLVRNALNQFGNDSTLQLNDFAILLSPCVFAFKAYALHALRLLLLLSADSRSRAWLCVCVNLYFWWILHGLNMLIMFHLAWNRTALAAYEMLLFFLVSFDLI